MKRKVPTLYEAFKERLDEPSSPTSYLSQVEVEASPFGDDDPRRVVVTCTYKLRDRPDFTFSDIVELTPTVAANPKRVVAEIERNGLLAMVESIASGKAPGPTAKHRHPREIAAEAKACVPRALGEVFSLEIDGRVRLFSTYDGESDARRVAEQTRKLGYKVRILRGKLALTEVCDVSDV